MQFRGGPQSYVNIRAVRAVLGTSIPAPLPRLVIPAPSSIPRRSGAFDLVGGIAAFGH